MLITFFFDLKIANNTSVFTDVPLENRYYNAVQYLKTRGVIEGYEDGTFRPDAKINRAEFLKLIMVGAGITGVGSSDCFADVKKESWYAGYVCHAKEKGWVKGYGDGLFRPERNVSKAEAIKILLEVFNEKLVEENSGEFEDVKEGDWYARYVYTGIKGGVIENEEKQFYPHEGITRGMMSKYLKIERERDERMEIEKRFKTSNNNNNFNEREFIEKLMGTKKDLGSYDSCLEGGAGEGYRAHKECVQYRVQRRLLENIIKDHSAECKSKESCLEVVGEIEEAIAWREGFREASEEKRASEEYQEKLAKAVPYICEGNKRWYRKGDCTSSVGKYCGDDGRLQIDEGMCMLTRGKECLRGDKKIALIEFLLPETNTSEPFLYDPNDPDNIKGKDLFYFLNNKEQLEFDNRFVFTSGDTIVDTGNNKIYSFYKIGEKFEEEARRYGKDINVEIEILGPYQLEKALPMYTPVNTTGYRKFTDTAIRGLINKYAYDEKKEYDLIYPLFFHSAMKYLTPELYEKNKDKWLDIQRLHPDAAAAYFSIGAPPNGMSYIRTVMHELGHNFCAEDLYELNKYGLMVTCKIPEGLAEPFKEPLFPQKYASIMCGDRIYTKDVRKYNPKTGYEDITWDGDILLEDYRISPYTAERFGWGDFGLVE